MAAAAAASPAAKAALSNILSINLEANPEQIANAVVKFWHDKPECSIIVNTSGKSVTFYSYNQFAVVRLTTNWTSTVSAGQSGIINAPVQNTFCVYPDNENPGCTMTIKQIWEWDGNDWKMLQFNV